MTELKQLAALLKHRLQLPLPGSEAQLRMAHASRRINLSSYKIPENVRWGAVLVLLYEENYTIKFPLILRQNSGGVHAGQISFPGGKFESADVELSVTALREAEEEISVSKSSVEILGKLTELYIPPSNFLVHPFVGVAESQPVFIPQPDEVVSVLNMSLDELLDEGLVGEKEITLSNGLKVFTPYFDLKDHTIWGATAMMLSEMKVVLKEILHS
jgi:8-oxo-dGTP pyrophosphatase MutT (NUDIX family)